MSQIQNLSPIVGTGFISTINNIGPNGSGNFTVESTDGSVTITPIANGVNLSVAAVTYYSLTPFIVGSDIHSQYSTIGAAITAAVAAGASSSTPAAIFIKFNGSPYTENPVLQDGINLIGFDGGNFNNAGNSTAITGKITFSGAGYASVQGLTLNTNGDYFAEFTGSSSVNILFKNCTLNATNANGLHNTNTAASILIWYCNGNCTTNTFFICTSQGVDVRYSYLFSLNTTTASTFTNAGFTSHFSELFFPVTVSGTGFYNIINSRVVTAAACVTTSGSGPSVINNSEFISSTFSSLVINGSAVIPVMNSSFQSSNTNVITGSGTLNYAFLAFYGSSSGVNVSTLTPLPTLI